MLEHGGRLRHAAANYQIAIEDWLDLSSGINPQGWPVPAIPGETWARLPETDDGLEAAAQAYYGVAELLPVAGSQAAIQALPLLRPNCRVGLIHPAYEEHRHAWQRAGHWITNFHPEGVEQALPRLDVLVLVHPNNPSGASYPLEQLLAWHAQLTARGGWLLVDEAFMDATPEMSLLPHSRPGLIILRSLGKFFGLAGARVGFVNAQAKLLARLADQLGPWAVSGPARRVAAAALGDRLWQTSTRKHLLKQGERLHQLLARHGLPPSGGCALFQWVVTPEADTLYEALARRGILTRRFTHPPSLRFGLPGDEAGWGRLATALEHHP